MQWRFGVSSVDETSQIGTGTMDEVWHGPWWTLPYLLLGSTRRVLFPSRGRDVPFTVSNYAYVDEFGRDHGALCIRSGEQRFYEGRLAFRFPLLFSGVADVRERWDENTQRFRIEVRVANKLLGPLFGYRGSFTVAERPCTAEEIPIDVRPIREECRE